MNDKLRVDKEWTYNICRPYQFEVEFVDGVHGIEEVKNIHALYPWESELAQYNLQSNYAPSLSFVNVKDKHEIHLTAEVVKDDFTWSIWLVAPNPSGQKKGIDSLFPKEECNELLELFLLKKYELLTQRILDEGATKSISVSEDDLGRNIYVYKSPDESKIVVVNKKVEIAEIPHSYLFTLFVRIIGFVLAFFFGGMGVLVESPYSMIPLIFGAVLFLGALKYEMKFWY